MEPDLWGQEKPEALPRGRRTEGTSQWSLTFEVRKSDSGVHVRGPQVQVAMEPDL